MPKKKSTNEKPEEQFARFLQAAAERGVEEAEAKKAFEALAQKKKVEKQTPK